MKISHKVMIFSCAVFPLFLYNVMPRSEDLTTDGIQKNKNPLNPDQRHAMMRVSHSKLKARCKVTRIGCFSPQGTKPIFVDQKEYPSATASFKDCVLQCSHSNFVVYALRKWCYCGNSVEESYVKSQGFLSQERPADCFRKKLLDVHRVLTCTDPDDNKKFMTSLIGCFPDSVHLDEDIYPVSGIVSQTECLMTCEDVGFLLATSVRNKTCSCATPKSSVSLPMKTESVDISFCETDSSKYMKVMRTYLEDKTCLPKQFLPDKQPLTALISFPGSGDVWLRHLIEVSSGIYTGSSDDNQELYREGYLGEVLPWDSNRVIMTKMRHSEMNNSEKPEFQRIILLIRDPYEAILSEFHRKYGDENGRANDINFKSRDWREYVKNHGGDWFVTIKTQLLQSLPVHVVFFEDLLANTNNEVDRILEFIGIKAENLENRLLCVQTDLTGNFHWLKDNKDRFSSDMKSLFNTFIMEARRLLEDQGKAILPNYER